MFCTYLWHHYIMMYLQCLQGISCLRICKFGVNISAVSGFLRFKNFSTMGTPVEKVDLRGMRVPYVLDETKRDFSVKDPIKLFDKWFAEARNTPAIREANAMAVATADKTGKPSVRYVLLKGYSKEGFTFFTNYNSRKGKEIVRIEGTIDKVSEKESDEYFHSRPKSSQLSAVVSNQSQVIESKEILLKKKQELEEEYSEESATIPKPDFWGGYCVVPSSFEFWCGRSDRLHDRIRFKRSMSSSDENTLTHTGEDGWLYEYLSP